VKHLSVSRLLVLLVVCIAGAYLAGRYHVIGKARDLLSGGDSSSPTQVADEADAESLSRLDELLHRRAEEAGEAAAAWRGLLEATDDAARTAVRTEIRARVLERLEPWPGPRSDRPPAIEPWYRDGDVEVSRVRVETFPGVELSAALLIPQSAPRPRPALLVLHGFAGTLRSVLEDVDYHHGFAMDLARRGFVVLAPRMVGWEAGAQSRLALKAMSSGWSMQAVDLWQLVRALDVLVGVDGVDAEHVGVYGISWGGLQGLRLAALDERLSLCVCSGHFADRFEWLFENPRFELVPGVHVNLIQDMDVLMDDLNLVSLVAPRHLAIECGEKDGRYEMARREFSNVEAIYRHLGRAERASFAGHQGRHEVSVETVMPFLQQWLREEP
jgi:pimeloyl-ACP methyl ester carboxylesterase